MTSYNLTARGDADLSGRMSCGMAVPARGVQRAGEVIANWSLTLGRACILAYQA